MILTASDYHRLHSLVFKPNYPGYKPNVIESPNGDGKKDIGKRYAHINYSYMTFTDIDTVFYEYLNKCHQYALDMSVRLGIPQDFWPNPTKSTLRVLEYPPGSTSVEHTDFDLFTVNLYRNTDNLRVTNTSYPRPVDIHYGEMLEIINPTYTATSHLVDANKDGLTQYSLVYFAIPNHNAVLPNGMMVKDWLEERIPRSRY